MTDLIIAFDSEDHLTPEAADAMRYDRVPYPVDFTGRHLIAQAAGLAWTSAPATATTPADLIEGTR